MKNNSASKLIQAVLIAACFAASAALAAPITFASGTDYDNGATQTTGVFRDVLNGSTISIGNDLGGTTHSALNFSGTNNNSPYNGAMTLYDKTPTDATVKTTFNGNLKISADVMTANSNNSKGAGILFLFNEGAGMEGLALSLFSAGNTDAKDFRLTSQAGEANSALATEALTGANQIFENIWYRLELDLTFSGSSYTVAGRVYNHTTGTDPNSAKGSQIGTQLDYTGALSGTIATPYEIGLLTRSAGGDFRTSVTNFDVELPVGSSNVPEPGSIALMGLGALGLASMRRRRQK